MRTAFLRLLFCLYFSFCLSPAEFLKKAAAQSASQTADEQPPEVTSASFFRGGQKVTVPLGLQGYSPVSIVESRKWQKGLPAHTVLLDGKMYLFVSEQEQQLFLSNTTKYAPAWGGNCIVSAVSNQSTSAETGSEENSREKPVAGNLEFAAIHQGRLFLFADAAAKATFLAAPQKFELFDLAFGGACPVCRVDERQDVRGQAAVGLVRQGKRYYFASASHKQKFLANPMLYLKSDPK